jgi:hypothetical protein
MVIFIVIVYIAVHTPTKGKPVFASCMHVFPIRVVLYKYNDSFIYLCVSNNFLLLICRLLESRWLGPTCIALHSAAACSQSVAGMAYYYTR